MSNKIKISVSTEYMGKQNNNDKTAYVFRYTVTIGNLSQANVQLLSRYWLITNGDGEKVEVSGEGVVGEQPIIEPNKDYSYTSASMLKTKVGTMEGYYYFIDADKKEFKTAIPAFSLAVPNAIH